MLTPKAPEAIIKVINFHILTDVDIQAKLMKTPLTLVTEYGQDKWVHN